MVSAAVMAAAVLSGTATLAWAQGAPMGTDASAASRNAAPASGFTIDQKGVKRTGSPAAGQAGSVTPGGGAAPQSGRMPVAGDGANVNADGAANRGKPSKEQKTFNESRSNNTRTASPIVSNGSGRTPGSAAAADDAAAQRASKINTSKSNLRTGNAPADAGGKPSPAEAAPASTSSIFK